MIGLDTNVILRLVVDDGGGQVDRAHALVAERCSPRDPAYVTAVAMVELAWVLQDTFGQTKAQTITLFDDILALSDIAVEQTVPAALAHWRASKADFADHVIGLSGRAAGCVATATFDRFAARSPDFVAVP